MKLVLVVATLVAAPLALADPNQDPVCDYWPGTESTGTTEITLGDGFAWYVDDRGAVTGAGVWIYQESNGVWAQKSPGVYRGQIADDDLQRGGASEIIPDDSEICTEHSPSGPDYLVF